MRRSKSLRKPKNNKYGCLKCGAPPDTVWGWSACLIHMRECCPALVADFEARHGRHRLRENCNMIHPKCRVPKNGDPTGATATGSPPWQGDDGPEAGEHRGDGRQTLSKAAMAWMTKPSPEGSIEPVSQPNSLERQLPTPYTPGCLPAGPLLIPAGPAPARNLLLSPVVSQSSPTNERWLKRATDLVFLANSLPNGSVAQTEAMRQAAWAEHFADQSVHIICTYVPPITN